MSYVGNAPVEVLEIDTVNDLTVLYTLTVGNSATVGGSAVLVSNNVGVTVQSLLENQVNIKSVNGTTLLGSGDLTVGGAALNVANTWTAVQTMGKSLMETKTAVAASNIDLSLGNFFSKTITALTTFTVSNTPTTGTATSFILDLTNGAAFAITWWAGVKWAGGTLPTLTAAGRDVLGFFTYDAGTTWTGMVLAKDVK